MPNKSQKKYLIIVVSLLLAQLIFLLVVKYANQDIPLNYFSFAKAGNIFNLLIYAGIIFGILIGIRNINPGISNKAIATFLVISWLLLIISFITTKVKIVSAGIYIFEQPGDKVLTGLLFLFFLLTLFYFLIFLWSRIISKRRSSIVRNIFSTMLMLILFLILTLIYIDNVGYASGRWILNKNKKNIAVVLGAAVWSGNIPSPTLSSRVDKALELLEKGFVGKILLTGGKAPGELPESEVGYEYARVKGVDTSKVIIENSTSSTTGQIRWIENNLLADDNSFEDIILISDAYHLPRAIEISKFYNIDIKVAESVHKQDFKDRIANKIRESIALFNFWNFAL
ncbi:MAG: YdcF family protein [Ignavibacteriaceae bacterium]|nr:YdcF family protein [Ignavibacteriaceae bacterium]